MTLQQEYRERFQEGKVEGIKEGKIEGKIETLYEELHMTVVEIAEKLAISEEEVQRIVDALKVLPIYNVPYKVDTVRKRDCPEC